MERRVGGTKRNLEGGTRDVVRPPRVCIMFIREREMKLYY